MRPARVVIGAAWTERRHCIVHCDRCVQPADSEALLKLVHAADPLWSQRAILPLLTLTVANGQSHPVESVPCALLCVAAAQRGHAARACCERPPAWRPRRAYAARFAALSERGLSRAHTRPIRRAPAGRAGANTRTLSANTPLVQILVPLVQKLVPLVQILVPLVQILVLLVQISVPSQ